MIRDNQGAANVGVCLKMMDIRELTETSLRSACESVLPTEDEAAGNGEQLCVAAIVGLSGDQVRGTLVLAASDGGLSLVRKHLQAGEALAEDSLGETGNLLAGHLKRSLATYGQVVTITPPIVVRGVTIEVCNSALVQRVQCDHLGGDSRMSVWLDYEAAPDIELSEQPDDSQVAEGDALFF